MTHDDKPAGQTADTLNLDPVHIPGMIRPIQTEGADVGVNHQLIHANVSGLVVEILPYPSMQANDWVEVFWGDDPTSVASGRVLPEHIGKSFALFVNPLRIPEGVHNLYATVTRSGGGSGGTTADLGVLVRTLFPGGTDPAPDEPGHQLLNPPEPALPPNGIIDGEAARYGVGVMIPGYRNMRIHDSVRLNWGGETILQQVTEEDIYLGRLVIVVPEQVILAAGDSDRLMLDYRISDEVHNESSDWSLRAFVTVQIGEGLFPAPAIVNPDLDADPQDVINLDKLDGDDLLVNVFVYSNGFERGDQVTLTWVGTTSDGQAISFVPESRQVSTDPQVLPFIIPNDKVSGLAGGRGAARYSVERDGSPAVLSKRSFVTFTGVERGLPKPEVRDAIDGVLDPALEQTLVIVPGAALEAGDTVYLTWLGTRPDGTALLHEDDRSVSGSGAGQPMPFSISGELIAPLDGGTLSVYYRLNKGASGMDLYSERESLSVGEARFELPAPTTRPPAQDGVIDPDGLQGYLEMIVAPWPGMQAGQTVHLVWKPDSGVIHDDYMPISPAMEGRDVEFFLDRDKVEEYRGARVELSYWVEIPGQPSKTSDIARFTIDVVEEPEPQPLPLPRILEAVGNELDPDQVLDGASVRIPVTAQLKVGDKVTVHVVGSDSSGSTQVEHEILPGFEDKAATIMVEHKVIEANKGGTFDLQYEITRAAGGGTEESKTVTYSVVGQIGSGALRVMGARFNAGRVFQAMAPRVLKAYRDDTLESVVVEWRYEDDEQWVKASEWRDDRPRQKLYVRNDDEVWMLNPENIVGNGITDTVVAAAFAAVRDNPRDLVTWGTDFVGGELVKHLVDVDNVADVQGSEWGYVARLSDGSIAPWGSVEPTDPPFIEGPFDLLRGNEFVFVCRKTDGQLYGLGESDTGSPISDEAMKFRDYIEFAGTRSAFAGLRANGRVLAWGDPKHTDMGEAEDYDNFVQIAASRSYFAAVREFADGTRRVTTWGEFSELPDSIAKLTNVKNICANAHYSYCIQLETGHLKSWASEQWTGGLMPASIAKLTNVVEVIATAHAYCGLLNTGEIVAWGDPRWGGKLTTEAARRTDVVQVTGNETAFAALCRDGTVVAWGNPETGGTIPDDIAKQLVDVRAIYGNCVAFAALTKDGEVVTWGRPEGGDSGEVQHLLRGQVTHSRMLTAAEAEELERRS